jgi:hypothetical protein
MHGRKNSGVTVTIVREKKEQNLTLTLPERNQSEVLDESFEVPEIDAETTIDLTDAESEVARIGPEIQLALRQIKPDIEGATRVIRIQQQELKKEMRKLEQELRNEDIQIHKSRQRKFRLPQADI